VNATKLLVGIATHKRPGLLRECLGSIAAQEGALPDIQVFVADNDPAGRQGLEVAEELAPQFRFPIGGTTVDEPGISAVRNAILDESRRRDVDFIAMIDDDEAASPQWLANLMTVQQATLADIVGGHVDFVFRTPPSPSIVHSRAFWTRPRPTGPTHHLTASNNFLVSARALADRGWPQFDHDFGLSGGGDSEWFMRLSHLGCSFAWAPEALVTEEVPAERATAHWVLRRGYRCGNANMRMAINQGPSRELIDNLWDMAKVIGSAPILAPLLLFPRRRLWLLRAWWTAAGRIAALLGRDYQEYAVRHSGEAPNSVSDLREAR